MGSRPLRMKVRWGCPPRVLSPPSHGPRADGHACPGSREHRAGGQQTAQSRALAAGRLVSRSGARLTTASCPGAFLPGGAWGADEFVDGPFHGQKPLVRLLRPHYPRRRSGQGGTRAFPRWRERSRSHLCHETPPLGGNRPRLPSKACKLTAALAAKAYSAAGQAASALHAMAILQVHQAKALKQVHEGSTDPGLMQELRTATDFALRATKVTARVPREGDVHHGGPGAPSLAQPGRDEGRRQGTLFLTPPSPREGCSATPSRASPSSSRRYSSRRGQGLSYKGFKNLWFFTINY